MTSTHSQSPATYPDATLHRADRAVRCAPFQLRLFSTMHQHSVDLNTIVGQSGVEQGYTLRPLTELAIESDLLWLIQVGLLRREVDGQGLTNSFRLTPLGHSLVERWQAQGALPQPTWSDRLQNTVNRWLRLPSWLSF